MSADGLNAGAMPFVPGGVGNAPAQARHEFEDSFAKYAEMMDDLETEADNEDDAHFPPPKATMTVAAVANVATSSGLPPHLAHHAAEFWFPECRDCQCCNGYKHGCQCAPSHGGVCKCSGGVPQQGPPPVQMQRGQMPSGGPHSGGGRGGGGRGGGNQGKVLCKFFTSPGGCRFGDNCRFAHS